MHGCNNTKEKWPDSGNVELFLDSLPSIPDQEINDISCNTSEQSNNTLWKDLRKGRITASNFYSVYAKYNTFQMNSETDVSSVLSKLMGYQTIK